MFDTVFGQVWMSICILAALPAAAGLSMTKVYDVKALRGQDQELPSIHTFPGSSFLNLWAQPRSLEKERCHLEFDAQCWTGSAWRGTPRCSGIPQTWEAFLFSEELKHLCSANPGPHCSRTASMCRAKEVLLQRGCKRVGELKRVRSGDVVFLRARSGHYLDVNGTAVSARWLRAGLWQSFILNKTSAEELRSGDVVRLRTHEGSVLSALDGKLAAGSHLDSDASKFVVFLPGGNSTKGQLITSDAEILLQNVGGKYVVQQDHELHMVQTPSRDAHKFVLQKDFNVTEFTQLNFGSGCKHAPDTRRMVQQGDGVFLRASSGHLIDIAEEMVQAALPVGGTAQRLIFEKVNGSAGPELHIGDSVVVHTSGGRTFQAQNASLVARLPEHGEQEEVFTLSKAESTQGPFSFGDKVMLQNQKHMTLRSNNGTIVLSQNATEEESNFVIEVTDPWKETLAFVAIPLNAVAVIEDAGLNHKIKWGRAGLFELPNVQLDAGPTGALWGMPRTAKCPAEQTPLSLQASETQSMFMDRETFCVTRHPYDRAVAEYVHRLNLVDGNENLLNHFWLQELDKFPHCSAAGLNHYLEISMTRILDYGGQYMEECHFLPQTTYILDDQRQWCAHVLRHEELPGSFNELMESMAYPVRLTKEQLKPASRCNELSQADLIPRVKDMLNVVYATDFEKLGYSPE